MDEGVFTLLDDGIIKEGNGKIPGFRLTAEGLKLVEQWHNERLIKIGIGISVIVLFLTLIQIYLFIYK